MSTLCAKSPFDPGMPGHTPSYCIEGTETHALGQKGQGKRNCKTLIILRFNGTVSQVMKYLYQLKRL
jgi:hypothetical protein